MLEILIGLLTKTLNKSDEEIRAIIYKEGTEELNEDALTVLLGEDATRIATIKANHKTEKESQYNRAKKEVSLDWETRLKSNFNLDTDLEGDELIAAAVKTKPAGTGDGELTDENVKAHSLYITLQNSKKTEIDNLNKEWQGKMDTADNEFSAKATRSNVNQSAIAFIKSKNPILPEDHAKANKRLSAIERELDQYKYEKEGNTFIVKNQDGSQLMDSHNNPVSFDELVSSIGDDYFDFTDPSNKDGDKPGTKNKNRFGDKPFDKTKIPADHDELQVALGAAASPEERTSISKAYLEAQKPSD